MAIAMEGPHMHPIRNYHIKGLSFIPIWVLYHTVYDSSTVQLECVFMYRAIVYDVQ